MINISDKSKEEAIWPLFRLGFRPFFLLGSLYSIIAILVWVIAFRTGQPAQLQVPAIWWHVHEMLFGFAMAIVVGFVLTAVQTWTGIPSVKSWRLGFIVLLWCLPRILFWTDTPLWLISSIECAFLAVAAFEIGGRVIKAKKWKNLFFIPLFAVAIVANFASYASIKGMPPFPPIAVWEAMLWWFALLLSVMGGRVIPFFTAKKFQVEKNQPILWLDFVANLPFVLLMVLAFFPVAKGQLAIYICWIAAVAQLIRWVRWKPFISLSEPLVWSLHFGYLAIPLTLLTLALDISPMLNHSVMHLLAIGGLGGVVLAMITRVSMGHTGFPIYQGPSMALGYLSILVAALLRSYGAGIFSANLLVIVDISALLWIIGYGFYLIKIAPMLIKPRVDGHPG
jgi:uncharacterized protein involved in response to NO